jgi:hypothetical protein
MSSQQHDARIGLVFELISEYFTGLTYDNLYGIAKLNAPSGVSITDEFISRVDLFISSMKNDNNEFRKIVASLHLFFRTSPKYTSTNFIEFVDRIIQIYTPDDAYFAALSANEKDQILSVVLCDAASGLAAFTTQPDTIRRIIDNHDAGRTITMRMIQNDVVQSLTTKRIEILNTFMKKKSQSRDVVPKSSLDSLQKKINALIAQNEELEGELDNAAEKVMRYKRGLRAAKATELQLRELTRELLAVIARTSDQSHHPEDEMRVPPPNTLGEVYASPFPVVHPHNTLGELVEVSDCLPQQLDEDLYTSSIQPPRVPLHPESITPDGVDELVNGENHHDATSTQVSSDEENLFQGVPAINKDNAPTQHSKYEYGYDDDRY